MGQVSLQGIMTMGSVRQSFVGIAGRKAMSHESAVGVDTQNSIMETSVPQLYKPATWGRKTCKGSGRLNSGVSYRIRGNTVWGCSCRLCDRHGRLSEGTSGCKL